MGYYFDDRRSIYARAGARVEPVLDAIARRYVGQNPPHPPTFRPYRAAGIVRGKDYRYRADFDPIFPQAKAEQFVYAWSKFWADAATSLMFDVTCLSPLIVWCNGEVAFTSNIFTERYADARHRVTIPVQTGWNHFVLRGKKTRAGFGWIFGSWLGKHPYVFMMPTPEREGREGWLFSEPLSAELESLPGVGTEEGDTGVRWLPERTWNEEERGRGRLARIYGAAKGAGALGWTKAFFPKPGTARYLMRGRHSGPIAIHIGEEEVFHAAAPGKIEKAVDVTFGSRDVIVVSECSGSDWGFEVSFSSGSDVVAFASPCNVAGATDGWIYAGPFKAEKPDPGKSMDLYKTIPSADGDTYWRLDEPDTWVRMYNENPLFGQWNYPLGVTLYGLLRCADALHSKEILAYVADHIGMCAKTFRYAMWDKGKFGGATAIHNLLTSIDSLDDCGSFGSVFLEASRELGIEGYREIVDYVADFISNRQTRLPDGTFYRKEMMHFFHENTMWADDLYMSVPFLCRYYALTGDRRYIDDAARQFLGFKERLFIPELKVMSHVYDFRRGMATGVPWGRGNGWTLFSLSELLAVLPADHDLRPAVLGMYRELCEGYLALQDDSGMWHQVLTHPDAYPETSCTSMFAYAFARGVRLGWLEKPEPYVKAVFKAWEGLTRISIDKGGNIYGVCRGSEFSFTPEYYKKELSWNLNDTHGIGIVLLAGVEVLTLSKYLEESGSRAPMA